MYPKAAVATTHPCPNPCLHAHAGLQVHSHQTPSANSAVMGYVGVGIVTGDPMPFAEATVDIDGQQHRLADLPLDGNYHTERRRVGRAGPMAQDRPREKAFWNTGMFANQNSATKLRNRFTLDQLTAEFGLDDEEVAESTY